MEKDRGNFKWRMTEEGLIPFKKIESCVLEDMAWVELVSAEDEESEEEYSDYDEDDEDDSTESLGEEEDSESSGEGEDGTEEE